MRNCFFSYLSKKTADSKGKMARENSAPLADEQHTIADLVSHKNEEQRGLGRDPLPLLGWPAIRSLSEESPRATK